MALATIMWANNETGVIFDVAEIGKLTQARGVPLHVDAVQTAGKLPIQFRAMPIDLLSISGHKFHGPKGVGALVVRRGQRWQPLVRGGPQERDRRGGTENVLGIVGMGVAAELAAQAVVQPDASNQDCVAASQRDGAGARAVGQPNAWGQVAALRDHFEKEVLRRVPDSHVNGDITRRLPNTSNIGFAGLEAEAILLLLSEQDICASAGAACSSGSLEPSHVLRAMHLPERIAHGAVRFSLSQRTTAEEIEQTLEALPAIIERLRAVLPV